MQKRINNIESKYDEQSIIMQAAIEANTQDMRANKHDSDKKMT